MPQQQQQPKQLPVTRFGRMLRSGAFNCQARGSQPVQDAIASVRNLASNLRTRLDAIAADPIATQREKREDAAIALAEARKQFEFALVKVHNAKSHTGGAIDQLGNVWHQFEGKQTPLAVKRLELAAEHLRRMDPVQQLAQLRAAEERRDLQSILAHSLVSPEATHAQAAFLRACRPAEFEAARTDAAAVRDLLAATATVAAGIDELTGAPDAYAVEGATGNDMLNAANGATDSVPSWAPLAPAVWPEWSR